ncbi:hypothetical protein OHB41_51245 [Streptomyces sp. NBC_01571]|uniref:hypothetical protein n=1 Tax=Streptomyces sp. NBC_01571 TaxID=2975883 RepID=UPI002251F064|nr:hypothetical protein [Streptomyces sp. NBC_01571]MCX4581335.1 hypothetical protein [Streptomyces sp. NBC_01571]
MADDKALGRRDRARAFVPELIPEPQDLERTGPLDARERRDLERIHAARDHHQAAKWMRGKALDAAFRRRLFRGEDGQRTRQQYLDDEWDGISESAAYREIGEWPLAKAITDVLERPAPDSHVRALVDVADKQGHEAVARWYAELRRHGQQAGRRVTAEVVANLADFLREGTEPERLEALFVPRQLPPARKPAPAKRAKRGTGEAVTGTGVAHGQEQPGGSFPNLGMSADGDGTGPAGEAGRWVLSAEHVARLSAWIADGASTAGINPDHAAELLLQALTDDTFQRWIGTRAWT